MSLPILHSQPPTYSDYIYENPQLNPCLTRISQKVSTAAAQRAMSDCGRMVCMRALCTCLGRYAYTKPYEKCGLNLHMATADGRLRTADHFFFWKAIQESINLRPSWINEIMQTADETRKKLATLIGQIISRCINDARMIPTVLNRDEVIRILMNDPALFQKLVQDEHIGKSELSKRDLTIHLDAVAELTKLDKLEAFEESFWEGHEVDLAPITDLTNQLMRTFAVFVGNAATLFDKQFEEFIGKFRQSLQNAGMSLKTFDFTPADVAILEKSAMSHLSTGDFLRAFTFERLLRSQIMMKQLVNLPATGFSLRENLVRGAVDDANLFPELVKFVIRVSYISQGSWDDLFDNLAKLVSQSSDESRMEQLIQLIEQDVFFSCNLLCSSYAEIRRLTTAQRRLAIERGLQKYRDQTKKA